MPGILKPILLVAVTSFAGEGLIPPLSAGPLERSLVHRLSRDLADGRCDELSLLEAALIAGGIHDPTELRSLVERFESACAEESSTVAAANGLEERLEALLGCLHRRFLTGEYRADQSDVGRTLTEGHFNCVTSTILFRALCERFGVASRAVAARWHLLCGLPGRPGVVIETTCRSWRFGGADDPPPGLRDAVEAGVLRELTDVQLIAKIDYNRGVAAIAAGQFAAAVDALQRACRWDRADAAAHDNLLAALNNWALAESDAGRFDAAVDLVEQGLMLAPGNPPLLANDLHIHQQWVRELCARQAYGSAVSVLERAHRRRPEVPLFDRGRSAVCGRWAQMLFAEGEFDEGWRVLARACPAPAPSVRDTAAEARLAAAICEKFAKEGRSDHARRLLTQALTRYPQDEALHQLERGLPDGGT